MKKLDKVALINELNNWGKKELGRPQFGKECLWADSMQGVRYRFDEGYNENLAKNRFGKPNKEYVQFMNCHDKEEPYLFLNIGYGVIYSIWSIEELKETAKRQHKVQVAYLKTMGEKVDECKNYKQAINFLKSLNEDDMPYEFPAANFVIHDRAFNKFLKDSINKVCKKFGKSIGVSKYKNSAYPYAKYLGFDKGYISNE